MDSRAVASPERVAIDDASDDRPHICSPEDGSSASGSWKCAVCYQQKVPCVLACGHLFCGECASVVQNCPLCRAPAVVAVQEVFLDRAEERPRPNRESLRGRGGLVYSVLARLFGMSAATRSAALVRSGVIVLTVYTVLGDESFMALIRDVRGTLPTRVKSTVDHLIRLGAPLGVVVDVSLSMAVREIVDHYAEVVDVWRGDELLDALMLSLEFGRHEWALANFALEDPQLRLSGIVQAAAREAVVSARP